jgi:regulator of protease activity HflC (stomatin/prohibitin superfamily)
MEILIGVAVIVGIVVFSAMRVLFEYERGGAFRLGKLIRAKGPGLVVLLPFGVDRLKRMDLRTVALGLASAREKAPATPDDEGR